MATNKQPIFRDFSFSFQPNPFNGDISVVKDDASVIQALKNLLLTDRFEVPFNSDVGGNIRALLFENPSLIIESELEDRIRATIENFEPRIELLDLQVKADNDNNAYRVTVIFTTVTVSTPTSISFFLERVL